MEDEEQEVWQEVRVGEAWAGGRRSEYQEVRRSGDRRSGLVGGKRSGGQVRFISKESRTVHLTLVNRVLAQSPTIPQQFIAI